VTFTFKGVQTQTKFTNEAIREYLTSLGDLQGVSGSMAAISGTLGGQISNLGDAYDNLLNTIGERLAPIYGKALQLTSSFLTSLNDLFKSDAQRLQDFEGKQYTTYAESFVKTSDAALKNIQANSTKTIKIKEAEIAQLKQKAAEERAIIEAAAKEARVAVAIGQTVAEGKIKKEEKYILALKAQNQAATDEIAKREKAIASVGDTSEKQIKAEYDARLKLLELEKQQQILMAQIRGEKLGEVGAEKVFAEKVYDLKKEYSAKNIGIMEAEVKVAKLTADQKAKAYEDAAKKEYLDTKQAKVQVAEEDKKAYDSRLAAMKKWQKEYEKGLADEVAAKKKAEEDKQALTQKSIEVGAQITDAGFSIYQAGLSKEMAAVDKRYNLEIALADGNEQKIAEIEARKAEKQREIQMKQFKAERAAAVARVIFETAAMIAKWSTNPVTAPLVALSLFAQAAQIGAILATPVPEFAEGTKGVPFKGGKAIVGERGVEKVVTESGKVYFTPPTATLVDLPKGAQVVPNHALSRQELFLASHYSKGGSTSSPVVGKLDELGSILRGLPITQVSMDEKGFEKFIRTPRRTTKILNNRFRSDSL
jgi:hypothetical protein